MQQQPTPDEVSATETMTALVNKWGPLNVLKLLANAINSQAVTVQHHQVSATVYLMLAQTLGGIATGLAGLLNFGTSGEGVTITLNEVRRHDA